MCLLSGVKYCQNIYIKKLSIVWQQKSLKENEFHRECSVQWAIIMKWINDSLALGFSIFLTIFYIRQLEHVFAYISTRHVSFIWYSGSRVLQRHNKEAEKKIKMIIMIKSWKTHNKQTKQTKKKFKPRGWWRTLKRKKRKA